eukprot:CAMPEP_0181298216 /NCGR_PEP_ID=MMETSP1101-20121128/5663_1 /TAXON_ID=46948 /ORGANISM="Rhodomonas abbreviata, Strain Caron Lab Isolate" /LENGTH=162 /DNA_ID=CAMNT_0023403221 /DNA_START=240 /DNA_END=729 /DNA_ORIENTATION=-
MLGQQADQQCRNSVSSGSETPHLMILREVQGLKASSSPLADMNDALPLERPNAIRVKRFIWVRAVWPDKQKRVSWEEAHVFRRAKSTRVKVWWKNSLFGSVSEGGALSSATTVAPRLWSSDAPVATPSTDLNDGRVLCNNVKGLIARDCTRKAVAQRHPDEF